MKEKKSAKPLFEDHAGPLAKDWRAELWKAQEELLDRKLREASHELLAALEVRLDRLNADLKQVPEVRAVPPGADLLLPPPEVRAVPPAPAPPVAHATSSRSDTIRTAVRSMRFLSGFSMRSSLCTSKSEEVGQRQSQEAGRTPRVATRVPSREGNRFSLQEAQYEKTYDLTRAFSALCARSRGSIAVRDVLMMHANQEGLDASHDSLTELGRLFEEAIVALNKELGIMVSSKSSQPAKQISLDTFIVIVQHRRLETLDPDIADVISMISGILVREDALRKVAKATNTSANDLYDVSTKRPKPTMFERFAQHCLNPIVSSLILMNAVVIGVDTYYSEHSIVMEVLEGSFTVMFLLELGVRLAAVGPCRFCFGPDYRWNIFDALVVLTSTAMMFIHVALGQSGNGRVISLMRLLRLAKLVRLLKLKVFKELALMISSVLSGARTLVWAVVSLAYLLFVIGVLLTEFFGRQPLDGRECDGFAEPGAAKRCARGAAHIRDHVEELFGSLGRSVFTAFRCFTEGCSSVDGTPLMPHLYNTYGVWTIGIYMLLLSFVIFGLFNLIMAVMVESTVESAKRFEASRMMDKTAQHVDLAQKLQEAIVMFCTGGDSEDDHSKTHGPKFFRWVQGTREYFTSRVWQEDTMKDNEVKKDNASLNLQLTHEVFSKALQKQEVQHLLDELDIPPSSRDTLFDTLDANCNGTIEINELVQGLLMLRGSVDKGDSVATLLAVRSMQRSMKASEALSLHQQQALERVETTLRSQSEHISRIRAGAHDAAQAYFPVAPVMPVPLSL